LFGDLADDGSFTAASLAAVPSLHRRGARATGQALVAEEYPIPGEATGR
jgi:mannitol 2-dehydrogenase